MSALKIDRQFFDAIRPTFGGALTQGQVDGMTFLIPEMVRRRLEKPQAAYVMATAFWETARSMAPVRESFYLNMSEEAREAWRKRNLTRYYPYYGRGYVQLTWDYNYRKEGDRLGIDLVTDMDRALEPEIARDILIHGMMTGSFTGRALSAYVGGNKKDYVNARRVVNGIDKASTIASIARKFEAALMRVDFSAPADPDPDTSDPEIADLLQVLEDTTAELKERLKL